MVLYIYDMFYWWVWGPRFVLQQLIAIQHNTNRKLPTRKQYQYDDSDSDSSNSDNSDDSGYDTDAFDNSDLSSDGL